MATTEAARPGFLTRVVGFYHAVVEEMKKVTWPDRPQTLDATWRIIVFVLFIGGVISIIDLILQAVLIQGIPSLFTGR